MAKRYGVPYKGSKNKIAEKIVDIFPDADNFYDLFAGGCAITHAALMTNRYKYYLASDINYMPIDLFMGSIYGKYGNDKRWISREEFNRLKHTDPCVKYCWSFGNNGKDYLYGKDIEDAKHALHDIVISEKVSVKEAKEILIKRVGQSDYGDRLIGLERLQALEHLNRLQALQADYSKVWIKQNSVIYCDIPYHNTNCGSYQGFNHDDFYEWALKQTEPIYISEYYMPDDFVEIKSMNKLQQSSKTNTMTTERVFTTKKYADYIEKQISIFDLGGMNG